MPEHLYVCDHLESTGKCLLNVDQTTIRLANAKEELAITYQSFRIKQLTNLISAYQWVIDHGYASLADLDSNYCTVVKKANGNHIKHISHSQARQQASCYGFFPSRFNPTIKVRE